MNLSPEILSKLEFLHSRAAGGDVEAQAKLAQLKARADKGEKRAFCLWTALAEMHWKKRDGEGWMVAEALFNRIVKGEAKAKASLAKCKEKAKAGDPEAKRLFSMLKALQNRYKTNTLSTPEGPGSPQTGYFSMPNIHRAGIDIPGMPGVPMPSLPGLLPPQPGSAPIPPGVPGLPQNWLPGVPGGMPLPQPASPFPGLPPGLIPPGFLPQPASPLPGIIPSGLIPPGLIPGGALPGLPGGLQIPPGFIPGGGGVPTLPANSPEVAVITNLMAQVQQAALGGQNPRPAGNALAKRLDRSGLGGHSTKLRQVLSRFPYTPDEEDADMVKAVRPPSDGPRPVTFATAQAQTQAKAAAFVGPVPSICQAALSAMKMGNPVAATLIAKCKAQGGGAFLEGEQTAQTMKISTASKPTLGTATKTPTLSSSAPVAAQAIASIFSGEGVPLHASHPGGMGRGKNKKHGDHQMK